MAQKTILGGATNVSVVLRAIDSADGTPETGIAFDTAGIDLWYRREGAALVSITEVTLAALTTAHADGGVLHIGDGYFRLDLPDAAVAAGVDGVMVGGTATDMIILGCYIEIEAVDRRDAVRGGMGALPNAAADAAGGLPISDAGGLDLDGRLDADVSSRMPETHIAATAGKVDAVALVDTTSVNTDMRGTDDALLAASAPANFGDLSITPTDGRVDVGAWLGTAALLESGFPNVNAARLSNSVISAAKISTGAIDSTKLADGAITSAKFASGAFDAVWTVSTRTLTSFGTLVADIWAALTSGLTTAGSVGKLVVDNLNATVSSRAPEAGGNVADIKAKTDNLPAAPAAVSDVETVGAAVDALNNLSAAEVNAEVDAALDEVVPDSVPAVGSRPSIRQGIRMVLQALTSRNITGTTETVRKEDNSTALITLTLDDAVDPTDVERAT